jgi:hypothetical protein
MYVYQIIKSLISKVYRLRNIFPLRQLLVWMFVLQFASGHNLVAEIFRLPSLIEHFAEHKMENKDISIAHFLWLHYMDASHEHSDSRHEHLPLHCHHLLIAESLLAAAPELCYFNTPSITAFAEKKLLFGEDRLHLPAPIFGFFRPPQFIL